MQDLGSRLRVFIIAFHDAGSLDGKLADLAGRNIVPSLVKDARLPEIAGLADRADFFDVVHAKMHTAGADGLAEAVVCVVFVVREVFEPALDEAGRDRLRADVHEPPLVEQIVLKIDAPGFNGVQNILRPGDQQPDDGAFFFCDCTKNPLRLYAAQQHGLAPGNEAPEPVHFRARVIERRNA